MSVLGDLWEGLASSAVKALRQAAGDSETAKMQANRQGIALPMVDYRQGSGMMSPAEAYLQIENTLLGRYAEYEAIEAYGDTQTILNVFADNATQADVRQKKALWIVSQDRVVQKVLDQLLVTLKTERNLWSIVRNMCKLGDNYEELVMDQTGIGGMLNLRSHTMRRVEDERGVHLGFIQDATGRGGQQYDTYRRLIQDKIEGNLPVQQPKGPRLVGYEQLTNLVPFEPHEVAHFRLRTKDRHSIYGTSVLDGARSIYRRSAALEDSAFLHQLQYAQDRLVYYVDCGDQPIEKVNAALEKHKNQLSKKRYIDPTTNQLSLRYSPLSVEDGIIVPLRKGQDQSRIESLPARGWPSSELLEFFQNRWYSAIGVPRSYVAQSDVIDKQPLASKDIQFARAVLRIQQAVMDIFEEICRIQLRIRKLYNPAKSQFEVRMTMPSAIYELALLEVNNARADLAQRMDLIVSRHWILQNLFDMTDDEIHLEFRRREEDISRSTTSEAVAQAQAQQILPEEPLPAMESRAPWQRQRRGWNEKELMEGQRVNTNEVKRKIDKILQNDLKLAHRLTRTQGLLEEMTRHSAQAQRKADRRVG